MSKDVVPDYIPRFSEFKLSLHQQLWLASIAIPRWTSQSGSNPTQVWFEVFIDYLDKLGYTVIKKSILTAEEQRLLELEQTEKEIK